jgi:NAD(P)-dependent dehydrogenase (short-subunit alcohol dehydrogenase family)
MRVIVIGASGTIGREVTRALRFDHEVVTASRTRGDLRVDISDPDSVAAMFGQAGRFDAVVSAAGAARFGTLAELNYDDYLFSLRNKLMGQVNLVRIGQRYINDNGSFTLTSGVLAREPMSGSSVISMVNAGLEGFVRAAQLEMERGVRVNVVSPVWVKETLEAMGRDSSTGMPASQVARSYVACVTGSQRGKVIDVRILSETGVSPYCSSIPSGELLRAVDEFNRGDWYACHETLEELWVGSDGEIRDLYQGLLQFAVALHHWREGNFNGTVHLLTKGADHLRRVRPICQRIEAETMVAAAYRLREALTALGPERMAELDPDLIPRIVLIPAESTMI